jgi:hypothetical protein
MAALLDRVTIDTWNEIIDATIAAAKSGDARARAWLAEYLLGKPQVEAPTPLPVIVQRISGDDELVENLARPAINRWRWQHDYEDDDEAKDAITARIAAELSDRIDEK